MTMFLPEFINVLSDVSIDESKNIDFRNMIDSISKNTQRAYSSQLRLFDEWAKKTGHQICPCSVQDLLIYLDYLEQQGRRYSTIVQACAAIKTVHQFMKNDSPTEAPEIRRALRAIRRRIGVERAKKRAATADIMRLLIDAVDSDPLASDAKKLRDRAILLVGYSGAFRRSELTALRANDLEDSAAPDGRRVLLIHLRRSKGDQDSQGSVKAVFAKVDAQLCPVVALRRWMECAGLRIGDDAPLFQRILKGGRVTGCSMTDQMVARIIKRCAEMAGLDSSTMAGHSLRRGFITQALANGASERAVMHQTGHKSVAVMREYQERENAITDNAAALI